MRVRRPRSCNSSWTSPPAALVDYLRSLGHDVVSVAEAMPQAEDTAILVRATSEERVLLTNDKDFGEYVFRSGLAHRGVILLRLRDESSANRVRVVAAVLDQYSDQIADRFLVVTESGVRIRPRPVSS